MHGAVYVAVAGAGRLTLCEIAGFGFRQFVSGFSFSEMCRVIERLVSDEIGVAGFHTLVFWVAVGVSLRFNQFREFRVEGSGFRGPFEGGSNYLETAWKRLGF